IGRVVAADAAKTELRNRFPDELCVAEIEVGERLGLCLAFGGVDGGCCFLNRIGDAVEFGRVAAIPEGVNGLFVAGGVAGLEGFRDDSVGATQASETRQLGVAAELDGDVAGTVDLVDGAWNP